MKIKVLHLLFAFFLLPVLSYGQSEVVKYTQVLLGESIDEISANEIRDAFYEYSQVNTSRMDNTTNVFLCVYRESNDFNDDLIIMWLNDHGYTVRCSYTEVFVSGKVADIKNTNCQ